MSQHTYCVANHSFKFEKCTEFLEMFAWCMDKKNIIIRTDQTLSNAEKEIVEYFQYVDDKNNNKDNAPHFPLGYSVDDNYIIADNDIDEEFYKNKFIDLSGLLVTKNWFHSDYGFDNWYRFVDMFLFTDEFIEQNIKDSIEDGDEEEYNYLDDPYHSQRVYCYLNILMWGGNTALYFGDDFLYDNILLQGFDIDEIIQFAKSNGFTIVKMNANLKTSENKKNEKFLIVDTFDDLKGRYTKPNIWLFKRFPDEINKSK